MKTLDSFIHRKPVVLQPHSTAYQAARAMDAQGVGCVLVASQDGELAGIVTDRDLACSLIGENRSSQTSLADIMTEAPFSLDVQSSVEDLLDSMEENGIRRVPITETRPGGRAVCIGIATLDDLIAAGVVDSGRLSRIVRAQIAGSFGMRGSELRRRLREDRSEARREQTLGQFYHTMARTMSAAPQGLSEELTNFLLAALIRRLHYTGAAQLIQQLPSSLQELLLALPAGPDRGITARSLLREFRNRFDWDEARSRSVIEGFFEGLRQAIDGGELDDVAAQLPLDLRELMVPSDGRDMGAAEAPQVLM